MTLLYRALGAVAGLALVIAAFLLASVILAAVAVVGLIAWAWVWWRTRGLRRAAQMRQSAVIEGEFRVDEVERKVEKKE